jgi:arylsulfatase
MMYRKLSLIGLLLSLIAQFSIAGDRPNILLIMADDLGFSDLGCYGGEIATPNLDSVAENGLRYTQFYNTARCWPSRASLLTGFYAQQVRRDSIPGAVSINQGTRPDWAPLLPRYLQPAGYRSYHSGKWHIDGLPIEEGFDRSYYLQDQDRFFSPSKHWKDDVPLPVVKKEDGYYGTIAIADHVIEVLD